MPRARLCDTCERTRTGLAGTLSAGGPLFGDGRRGRARSIFDPWRRTSDTISFEEQAGSEPGSWAAPQADAHSVHFYAAEPSLIDELAGFVSASLARGHSVLVIATQPHCQALEANLADRGVDLGPARRLGRYEALDARRTLAEFLVDGQPDEARFASVIGSAIARAASAAEPGHRRVAAFGEMVALLCDDGNEEAALTLEQIWNRLARTHSFDLHCAYPMRMFGGSDAGQRLQGICAEHGHVVPTETYTSLTTEEDRGRAITFLQQKAEALEYEIRRRERLEDELREAVATRDAFMSIAAHELRTPLTSLRGFTQLLLRNIHKDPAPSPTEIEELLRTVETQKGKLAQLVGRLLDTAHIDSGKLQLDLRRADLAEVVRGILAQHPVSPRHRLVYSGPDHLEATIDQLRLEQVITNPLDNALKFSPQGGEVIVELAAAGGRVRLSVTDEGVGIPADERELIFDRFHQAHNPEHLSGIGLGLFVSRQIAELHGGSVYVEDPGLRGSRFVVELPQEAAGRRS
jgi:signal transduction histidine kinase